MSLCFANNCLAPINTSLLAKYILVIIRSDQRLVVIGVTHGITIFLRLSKGLRIKILSTVEKKKTLAQ